MDFTKYINTDTENTQDTAQTPKDIRMQSFNDILTENKTEDGAPRDLSEADTDAFIRRIFGTDENGKPRCTISYGGWRFKDGDMENAVTDEAFSGLLKNAYVRLIPGRLLPDFYEMDIVFDSPCDMGLRLLWLKMEQYRLKDLAEDSMEAKASGGIHVFYFNIMENPKKDSNDLNGLVVCNVLNPMLAYLTRVSPAQDALEASAGDNEKIGGNILRMLIHASMVSFEVTENIDSAELRKEAADMVRDEMLKEEYESVSSSMEEGARVWDEDNGDDFSTDDFSQNDFSLNDNLAEDMAGEE